MSDELDVGASILTWLQVVPTVAAAAWILSSFAVGVGHAERIVRVLSLAVLGLVLSLIAVASSVQWALTDLILLPRLAEAVMIIVAALALVILATELKRQGALSPPLLALSTAGMLTAAAAAGVLVIEVVGGGLLGLAKIDPDQSLVSHLYVAAGEGLAAVALLAGLLAGHRHADALHGFRRTLAAVAGILSDLRSLSWRRVLAVARYAVKEAIRRKVLLVFLVFALIFMFAGWYLGYKDNQVKVYVSFVTKVTSFFVVLVTIIMAATSLPTDISSKTIHTVVTKPIRRLEVVFGRILGYVAVATLFLLVMAVVSLVYMDRRIRDDQRPNMIARVPIHGKLHFERGTGESRIRTNKGKNVGYEWEYRSYIAGAPSTETAVWEFADVDPGRFDDPKRLQLELSLGVFRSKKGVVGRGVVAQLAFVRPFPRIPPDLDFSSVPMLRAQAARDLQSAEPAIRSVDQAACTLGVTRADVAALAAHMHAQVGHYPDIPAGTDFRMVPMVGPQAAAAMAKAKPKNVGDAVGLAGVTPLDVGALLLYLQPRSGSPLLPPDIGSPPTFEVREYRTNTLSAPVEFLNAQGALRVECRCISTSQYLGMAAKDLYLLPRHGSFAANFFKGMFGIWMQVVVIAVVAVAVSTFLSGVISMLVTIGIVFAGNVTDYLRQLATDEYTGGGPIEAFWRIGAHQNVVKELPKDIFWYVTRGIDDLYRFVLDLFRHVIPDMTSFDATSLVANGFDIPGQSLAAGLILMVGYVVPCAIFGCLCLKAREIAK